MKAGLAEEVRQMDRKLLRQALVKFFAGLILISLLLFIPAGSLGYFHGWLFIGILFIPMFIAGMILIFKDPELLRRRLDGKEDENVQKLLLMVSALMFLLAFVIAGLNFRFDWLHFPSWAVTAGVIIFLLAYVMYAEVMRENTYLSRTVKVEEDQKVISTGLYGIVRHPMYSSTLFLFLSMPIVLDSPISFFIMLIYIPVIAVRMKNEEEVLKEELRGYREYMEKVRYRVIPFIW